MSTAATSTKSNVLMQLSGVVCTLVAVSTNVPLGATAQSPVYRCPPAVRALVPAGAQDDEIALQPWLEELKAQTNLTLAGLASMLGVSRPTLYSWGRGIAPREGNAERLTSFRAAISDLVAAAPGGTLPALWQHQKLPSFGLSFVQGMRLGHEPTAMARDLVAIWQRDAKGSAAIASLFKSRT